MTETVHMGDVARDMNILLTLNTYYARYAIVMLTSLLANNQGQHFEIYILFSELHEMFREDIEAFLNKNKCGVHFLQVDKELYSDFPKTEALTEECYFICLAHKILPDEVNKVLYLDSDIIVNGPVKELYEIELGEAYFAVCGQTISKIEGNYYKRESLPEKGEYFNTGVILFNVDRMRRDIKEQTYREAAVKYNNKFQLADQGLLNIVFQDNLIYIDSYRYNFRIGMLIDHYMEFLSYPSRTDEPVLLHFVMGDYYRIGMPIKPWDIWLGADEMEELCLRGVFNRSCALKEVDRHAQWMLQLWWKYARQTNYYKEFIREMHAKREAFWKKLDNNGAWRDNDVIAIHRKQRQIFKNITENQFEGFDDELTYEQLERYIDGLDEDIAIRTMQNLFRYNCSRLNKKDKIKVAFIVYSSSEWQCEGLYRAMEEDEKFEPYIVVCAYGHGTEESIRNTYINTCAYFRKAKSYHIEYMGYCSRWVENRLLNRFDILFYFIHYRTCMVPYCTNMICQSISKLVVHIPYGIYQVNGRDNIYETSPLFKMCWKHYESNSLIADYTRSKERLKGYNIVVSGVVKLDGIADTSIDKRNVWKGEAKLKLIWAPHFNLQIGMNGTFHENYRWFYETAKNNPEISWVVRPHPRMEWGVIEYGVFESEEEYRKYLMEWDKLPNACVIADGDYLDIFVTSDAMIHDSVSFTGEYMRTGHPQLRLLSERQRPLNIMGKKIAEAVYSVRGNDYEAIENFIMNVVNGIDPGYETRKKILTEYLLSETERRGLSVASYIMEDMKGSLCFSGD